MHECSSWLVQRLEKTVILSLKSRLGQFSVVWVNQNTGLVTTDIN